MIVDTALCTCLMLEPELEGELARLERPASPRPARPPPAGSSPARSWRSPRSPCRRAARRSRGCARLCGRARSRDRARDRTARRPRYRPAAPACLPGRSGCVTSRLPSRLCAAARDLVIGLAELDAAGLAARAGMDLRLHRPVPAAELGRGVDRLIGRERHARLSAPARRSVPSNSLA